MMKVESGVHLLEVRSESWSAYVGVRSPIVHLACPVATKIAKETIPFNLDRLCSTTVNSTPYHCSAKRVSIWPLRLSLDFSSPTTQQQRTHTTCLDSVTESMTFFPQSPTPRAIASTFNVNHWQSHNPFLNAHQVRGRLNDYIYYQSPVTPPVFPSILTDPLQFPRERLSQDSIFTLAKILKTRRSWKTCIRLRKRR